MNPKKDNSKALAEELEKLKDMAARAQADLQNAKMRMEKEAEESRKVSVLPMRLALWKTMPI